MKNLTTLLRFQKKLSRIINFANFRDHAAPLMHKRNAKCFSACCQIAHDIMYNSNSLIGIEMKLKHHMHQYPTSQSNSKKILTFRSNTSTGQRSISHHVIPAWNDLDVQTRKLTLKRSFSRAVKQQLLAQQTH
eukprot:Lithocolla_globosa_v1_NODE_4599_length_1403_cov_7.684718.p1 type:complete len:133 gc:universal NODE_4599_length_1403_cov_7.684718:442-44(-)